MYRPRCIYVYVGICVCEYISEKARCDPSSMRCDGMAMAMAAGPTTATPRRAIKRRFVQESILVIWRVSAQRKGSRMRTKKENQERDQERAGCPCILLDCASVS